MKWGEWCRQCDIALGYYWHSDNMSEGVSPTSDDTGSSHDDVKGWEILIFLDYGWPMLAETLKNKILDKGCTTVWQKEGCNLKLIALYAEIQFALTVKWE